MMRRSFSIFVYSALCLCLFSPFNITRADTSACTDQVAGKSNAQLQAELDACNQEIAQWTSILNSTKQESASYAQEVAVLTAKINAAQANIKSKNIAIANLSKDIDNKVAQIQVLDDKLSQGHDSIAQILRKTNDIDSYSLAEAILSDKDFSSFFADVSEYTSTENKLQDLFNLLRGVKVQTQAQKEALDKQRQAQADAKAAIEAAKKEVEASQAEKKTLLAESQSKEKTYQQVLSDKQAKAAQIRATLFPLLDTAAIPFGTALGYAQEAGAKTGVRPAFLLAILTQESDLGKNVGACYLTNLQTGDGKGANSGNFQSRVMSPTRDVPIFIDILQNVGGDPYNTRVSCWQPIYNSRGAPIGWGGAMGPAQFIPSTWKLFSTRISTYTNSSTPNPWSARDAFFASAIYLSDLGASTGNFSDEKNAACRYYSGSSCRSSYANNYGASVMTKAATIQSTMIDPLQGV